MQQKTRRDRLMRWRADGEEESGVGFGYRSRRLIGQPRE
jgi:hypothetical protein